MSVAAQISPEKARRAAQAFAKNFYGHNYYLSPLEKNPNDISKKPKSADDYAAYANVFPDIKTIDPLVKLSSTSIPLKGAGLKVNGHH